jgi:hypothetical protein
MQGFLVAHMSTNMSPSLHDIGRDSFGHIVQSIGVTTPPLDGDPFTWEFP